MHDPLIVGPRGKASIPKISKLNNYEFTGTEMQAWRAYKIGDGKKIRYTGLTTLSSLNPIHSQYTHGKPHSELAAPGTPWIGLIPYRIPESQRERPDASDQAWVESFVPDSNDDGLEEGDDCGLEASTSTASQSTCAEDDPRLLEGPSRKRVFPCSEEGCIKVYQSYHNWWKHVSIGKHIKRAERQYLRDFSIENYVRLIEQNQVFSNAPGVLSALQGQRTEETAMDATYPLEMGWALKDRKEVKRFTQAQKQYLVEKFDEGIRDSKKYDPREVAKLMRRNPQFPTKEDWLTAAQIQSFWSRLAKGREKALAADSSQGADDEDMDPIDDDHIGSDDLLDRMFDQNVHDVVESLRPQIFDQDQDEASFDQRIDETIEAVLRRVAP